MNFWKKTKGAVSVFLVIILVPMMTVSSLFVDAGKVSLAESVAESAGDLALNTALTNYDTQLKDLYGLFATAQDTTELYERVKDYYRACITSAGVGVEEAEGYVDTLMASLGQVSVEGDTSDILNMELIDSEFNISKVVGANLANPAVLKRGIVEFMKYRAPINTGLSFLSTLTSFTTLEKQTDLVDKRTEYYEAQQGVMEQLQEAWRYINEYNKSALVTDPSYFTNMQAGFDGYENVYKEDIHKKTVMDLYDTKDHMDYKVYVDTLVNIGNYTYPDGQVKQNIFGFRVAYVKDYPVYTSTARRPWTLYDSVIYPAPFPFSMDNLPTATTIENMMSQFYSCAYESIEAEKDIGGAPDGIYEIQYFVQKHRSGKLQRFQNSGEALYDAFQRLENAMAWLTGYDETSRNEILDKTVSMKTEWGQFETKKIREHYDEIITTNLAQMCGFSVFSDKFRTISENKTPLTWTTTVNNKVKGIGDTIAAYRLDIQTAIDNLKNASTALTTAKTSITSGDLDEASTNWSGAANDSDLSNSPMAEQDQAEIKNLKEKFNGTEIQILIDLLDAVVEKLELALEQLDSYKYQDVSISSILSYDQLVTALETKVTADRLLNVPITTEELKAEAESMFNWTSGTLDVSWVSQPGTKVRLYEEEDLEFYKYLYKQFNEQTGDYSSTEVKEEDPENGEDLYDSLESTASGAATEDTESATGGNTASANEISDCANLPSSGNSGAVIAPSETPKGNNAAGATSGNMGTLFGDLAEKAMDLGTDIRDNLYITDYILSMFSYDTLVAEYEKKNPGGDSSKITTLTCAPINAENNYAYGREVEYIIFGGSNTENVLKAYASIYGIRLAFNLIYAFTDSSIRDTAFAIATPISAATLGVIPVPLIQGVIIVGIACVESGIDLANLQKGEAVPLFKTAETWSCSPRGLLNAAKGLAGEALKKGAEMIVDEGALKLGELLDMTDEQLTDYMKDGESQITDYIEESYDSIITQNATVAIQKLTTLVTSTIEKNITATVDEMSAQISDQLDAWIDQERAVSDTTSLDFIVKSEAVDIIKESFIPMAIEAISSATNDVESEISNIATALETKIADIKNKIVETIVTNPAGQVYAYKDDMVDEIRASIDEGADKLKETINSKLDGILGSSSSGIPAASKGGTGLGQLLAFRYSDYLRLFLVIGLFANEQGTLLRTADVIQVNMANMVTGNADYQLANSAAYLHMSATIQVKPTLLALPLFADVEGNPSSNSNWYTIHYEDYKGY
ncbi:MAG: DUF5702 domain-containing protein [Oscillospiraceae bacterium]|nr:DUF5702 domain-containing protein [Oscillospiraceae bacterium]